MIGNSDDNEYGRGSGKLFPEKEKITIIYLKIPVLIAVADYFFSISSRLREIKKIFETCLNLDFIDHQSVEIQVDLEEAFLAIRLERDKLHPRELGREPELDPLERFQQRAH